MNILPTSPSGVQLAIPILPPGLQTRSSSAAACSCSGANIAPKTEVTTSNSPSPKGSSAASPSTNSTSSRSAAARSRPRSSSAGTKSTPTTPPQERRAAASAALPLPQATSRTRSPGTIASASASSSETIITRPATIAKSPSDQVCCCAFLTAPRSIASLILAPLVLANLARPSSEGQLFLIWVNADRRAYRRGGLPRAQRRDPGDRPQRGRTPRSRVRRLPRRLARAA